MEIKSICNYRDRFEKFIELITIVEDAIENPHWIREKEKLEDFVQHGPNYAYCHLREVKEAIDEVKIVKKFGKFSYVDKIICFIHSVVMDICQNDRVKCAPLSEKIVENVKGILCNKTHTHHSHITGEVIGYSHSFSNFRVRGNKEKISVVAHSVFRFDLFFFLKGIRAGSWRARDISIGGKSPTDINFAHIGN